MDYSPSGSSVHGISQARILEWVSILSSRASSQPRDQTRVSCISCNSKLILYLCTTWGSLRTRMQGEKQFSINILQQLPFFPIKPKINQGYGLLLTLIPSCLELPTVHAQRGVSHGSSVSNLIKP